MILFLFRVARFVEDEKEKAIQRPRLAQNRGIVGAQGKRRQLTPLHGGERRRAAGRQGRRCSRSDPVFHTFGAAGVEIILNHHHHNPNEKHSIVVPKEEEGDRRKLHDKEEKDEIRTTAIQIRRICTWVVNSNALQADRGVPRRSRHLSAWHPAFRFQSLGGGTRIWESTTAATSFDGRAKKNTPPRFLD